MLILADGYRRVLRQRIEIIGLRAGDQPFAVESADHRLDAAAAVEPPAVHAAAREGTDPRFETGHVVAPRDRLERRRRHGRIAVENDLVWHKARLAGPRRIEACTQGLAGRAGRPRGRGRAGGFCDRVVNAKHKREGSDQNETHGCHRGRVAPDQGALWRVPAVASAFAYAACFRSHAGLSSAVAGARARTLGPPLLRMSWRGTYSMIMTLS